MLLSGTFPSRTCAQSEDRAINQLITGTSSSAPQQRVNPRLAVFLSEAGSFGRARGAGELSRAPCSSLLSVSHCSPPLLSSPKSLSFLPLFLLSLLVFSSSLSFISVLLKASRNRDVWNWRLLRGPWDGVRKRLLRAS